MVAGLRICLVVSTLTAAWHGTAVGQSSAIEEHRRRVRFRQREIQRKLEESRRKRESEKRRQTMTYPAPGPPIRRTTSSFRTEIFPKKPERPKPDPRKVRYKFVPGKAFVYVFTFASHSGQRDRYLAGFASFKVEEASDKKARLAVRDNIRYVSSLSQVKTQLPRRTHLLKSTFHIPVSGDRPSVDGLMPSMLGTPRDWFFPPMPDTVAENRASGYSVERGSGFSGAAKWDKLNRAYFKWSVKPVRHSATRLRLKDTRFFRTENGSLELKGTGEIDFDLRSGLMRSRQFKGTYKSLGRTSNFVVKVNRLSREQISKLAK